MVQPRPAEGVRRGPTKNIPFRISGRGCFVLDFFGECYADLPLVRREVERSQFFAPGASVPCCSAIYISLEIVVRNSALSLFEIKSYVRKMHITDFQIYKINLGHMAISNSGPQTVLRLIPEIYRSPHIPELMRRARSLTELITDLQCTPPEVKKADCELQHPPAIRIENVFYFLDPDPEQAGAGRGCTFRGFRERAIQKALSAPGLCRGRVLLRKQRSKVTGNKFHQQQKQFSKQPSDGQSDCCIDHQMEDQMHQLIQRKIDHAFMGDAGLQ